MKVNVDICPSTGQTKAVVIDGEAILSNPYAQAQGAASTSTTNTSSTSEPDHKTVQAMFFVSELLVKAFMVILKVLMGIVEFFIYLVIWREPGAKGFCAGLCRLHEKKLAEAKAKKALQPQSAQPQSFVQSFVQSMPSASSFGASAQVLGQTSQAINTRADQATTHHAIDGPEGMKLKLTLFPQLKTVQRRIAVPYTNKRLRIGYHYVRVSDIGPSAFSDTYQFCLQNVVQICVYDISRGLFAKGKALPVPPSSVFDLCSEKAPAVTPANDALTSVDAPKVQAAKVQDTSTDAIDRQAKQAQGVVKSMGLVNKKFDDKPGYQVYEVVVCKADGVNMEFGGQQLQEKARAGVFKLGDLIEIVQGKVKLEKTDQKGKTSKNTMNVFTIKVLQPA